MTPPRKRLVDSGRVYRVSFPAFVLIFFCAAATTTAFGGERSAGGGAMSAEVRGARVAEARNRARQLARLGIVGARGRAVRADAAQRRAAGGRKEYDELFVTAARKARRAAAAGDGWCRGLSDGLHGDPLAHPPHSAYFRCSGFSLAGLFFCLGAARFDEERGECVEKRAPLETAGTGEENGAAWWVGSSRGSGSSSSRSSSSSSGRNEGHSKENEAEGAFGAAEVAHTERDKGREKEREKGREEEAREEGRAEGREEGRAVSRREALRVAGGAGGRNMGSNEKRGSRDGSYGAITATDTAAANPAAAAAAAPAAATGTAASSASGHSSPTASSPSPRPSPPSPSPVDQQALLELNALLEFKASVIDFRNVLRSWVVPRSASNATDPYSFLCEWRFVECSKPAPPSKGGAKAAAAASGAAAASPRRVIALEIQENAQLTIGILLTSTRNITNSIAITVQGSTSGTINDGSSSSSSSSSSGSSSGSVSGGIAAIPPLLPQSFSSLTALQTLTIQNSPYYPGIAGLLGAFPTQLSACSSLQKLDLAYQRILGGIPDEISRLKSLKVLSLSSNLMTGSLPTSLFSLPGLINLKLANNAISGSIPRQISLLSNTLTGLDLTRNHLSGTLPEEIGQMTKLLNLDFMVNHLSGSLPEEIGQLTRLGMTDFAGLSLSNNNFSGSLPASISNLRFLQFLYLSSNHFSGSIPQGGAFLSSMTQLASLDLSNNHFTGSLPLSFACTTSIWAIGLSNNRFQGTLPGELDACMKRLDSFDISSNNLSGQIPDSLWRSLASADLLTTVILSNNSFSGSLSPALGKIALLFLFDASNNQFSGPLPDLKACPDPLGVVLLANNSFSGSVPASLICPSLLQLDLRNNSLSGDLPETLVGRSSGQPGNSRTVTAAVPRTGVARSDVYFHPTYHIKQLLLSHNSFTGPLPFTFPFGATNCSDLKALMLDHNNFAGPAVPAAFPTCRSINEYDVSNNQLSGTVAEAVKRLSHAAGLVSVRLHGNRITGEIPTKISWLSSLGELDLSGNQVTGSIPDALSVLNRLQSIDLSRNSLSSSLPAFVGNLSSLSFLDVSLNALSGSIPSELSPPFLPFLSLLNLSHNTLTGTIPYGFTDTNTTATLLDFSYNFLQGQIYPGNLSALPASSFAGNPGLCGGAGYPPCPESPTEGLSAGAIAGIVVGSLAVVVLMAVVVVLWFALFFHRASGFESGKMLVFEHLDFKLDIKSVIAATDNFSDAFLLGRGGFGSVYKATLADGREVAIKRLALGSSQGEREFAAEMSTLGNVRHRNLVVLVAAYLSPPPSQERLLIYDFLPGGSLDHVLAQDMPQGGEERPRASSGSCSTAASPPPEASFSCPPSPMRRWEVRWNILVGTARGMKYLHHNCIPGIIHRDMKPANVLLDDNLEAQVADFGLAREIDMGKSHMSTSVFGTIGYLAPEYSQRGRLSFKSDVFAFGVLVLQVVTGKLPTDQELGGRTLARWVKANPLARFVDRRIDDREQHADEIRAVVGLGLHCTSRVAADRPSMAEALELLERLSAFAQGMGEGEAQEADGGKGADSSSEDSRLDGPSLTEELEMLGHLSTFAHGTGEDGEAGEGRE